MRMKKLFFSIQSILLEWEKKEEEEEEEATRKRIYKNNLVKKVAPQRHRWDLFFRSNLII
jgi:hypothetical protein